MTRTRAKARDYILGSTLLTIGIDVVPNWDRRCPQLGSTLSPIGIHVAPNWDPRCPQLGSTLPPIGIHVAPNWDPRCPNVVAGFSPRSPQSRLVYCLETRKSPRWSS